MGAPIGNKNAAYSPDEREVLKAQYIQHLTSGFNKDDFIPCHWETVEGFFVSDSEKEELSKSLRANRFWWMERFMQACEGLKPQANMTGLIFALKNKCGWRDKQEVEHSGTVSIAQQILDARKKRD